MNETFDYLRTFAAFPFALRRFLAQPPLTLAESRRIVRERMARRKENFLHLIEHSVYGWPGSPYLALLERAGCTLDDVRALIRDQGLEGALKTLRAAGVYVTFEEFKGRKPIERPGLTLPVKPEDFDNPAARRDFNTQTGGSTGRATSVGMNMDHVYATAPYGVLLLAAHGLLDAPRASWSGFLPHSSFRALMSGGLTGLLPQRWFSPVGWRDTRQWVKYGLGTGYMLLVLRLMGVRVPWPEVVKPERAAVIAQWMAETLRAHGRCVLSASVSRGVRVCLAAEAAGLDLTGAVITGGGEPVTPSKSERVQRVGARYMSSYFMTEAGRIGAACARPAEAGDVHLLTDGFAMFSHPYPVEGFDLTVPAFNLTSLLPAAPKVMLNTQMDDYGIIEERRCGCELESYGYTTHVREIRSYSKLTGEGVTLIGNEIVRLIEHDLPARFGGSPLDYQLIEEEDEQGLTRLFLHVSPSVKLADEQAIVEALLAGLRRSSPMADAARAVWQNSGTIQIKRVEPVWTGRGKFMPLQVRRRPRPGA